MPHQTAETLRALSQMTITLSTKQQAACEAGARAWELLAALVKRLDAVHAHPQYKGVWNLLAVHGGRYTGPNYNEELSAARTLLYAEGR